MAKRRDGAGGDVGGIVPTMTRDDDDDDDDSRAATSRWERVISFDVGTRNLAFMHAIVESSPLNGEDVAVEVIEWACVDLVYLAQRAAARGGLGDDSASPSDDARGKRRRRAMHKHAVGLGSQMEALCAYLCDRFDPVLLVDDVNPAASQLTSAPTTILIENQPVATGTALRMRSIQSVIHTYFRVRARDAHPTCCPVAVRLCSAAARYAAMRSTPAWPRGYCEYMVTPARAAAWLRRVLRPGVRMTYADRKAATVAFVRRSLHSPPCQDAVDDTREEARDDRCRLSHALDASPKQDDLADCACQLLVDLLPRRVTTWRTAIEPTQSATADCHRLEE